MNMWHYNLKMDQMSVTLFLSIATKFNSVHDQLMTFFVVFLRNGLLCIILRLLHVHQGIVVYHYIKNIKKHIVHNHS